MSPPTSGSCPASDLPPESDHPAVSGTPHNRPSPSMRPSSSIMPSHTLRPFPSIRPLTSSMRCGSPTCLMLLSTLRQSQSSRTIAFAGGASLGINCRAAAAAVCFRSRRGKGEAVVLEAVVGVGTFPSSASSPWGLCSPALSPVPGWCPSRFKVSLISQAQVLSCVPVQRGRGLGTLKLKG